MYLRSYSFFDKCLLHIIFKVLKLNLRIVGSIDTTPERFSPLSIKPRTYVCKGVFFLIWLRLQSDKVNLIASSNIKLLPQFSLPNCWFRVRTCMQVQFLADLSTYLIEDFHFLYFRFYHHLMNNKMVFGLSTKDRKCQSLYQTVRNNKNVLHTLSQVPS